MSHFFITFDKPVSRFVIISLLIHCLFLSSTIFSFPSYNGKQRPFLVFLGAVFPKQDFVGYSLSFPRGAMNPVGFNPSVTAVRLPVGVLEKPFFNNRITVKGKKMLKKALPMEQDKAGIPVSGYQEPNKANEIDHVPEYVPLKLELR